MHKSLTFFNKWDYICVILHIVLHLPLNFSLRVASCTLALNSNHRNLFERGKDRPHVFRTLVSCCHLAVLLYSSQPAMDIDFWPSASRQVTSFLWYSAVTLKSGWSIFYRNTSKCFKTDEGCDCRYFFEMFRKLHFMFLYIFYCG